jgi:hypothetical protein
LKLNTLQIRDVRLPRINQQSYATEQDLRVEVVVSSGAFR